jgi:hypothetical protein
MPIVQIEPTDEHPVPYDTGPETASTFIEELEIAGKTAELQVDLGAPLELEPNEAAKQETLLKEAIKKHKSSNLTNVNTAFAAAAFLKTYGQQLALDVASARAAVTNKLMELANCGDPKFELKALELLGKHSDIGLFTERSEITINYKNPEDLENAIKERVKRLLNANIIDITPLETSLDDELGLNKRDQEDQEGQEDQEDQEDQEKKVADSE